MAGTLGVCRSVSQHLLGNPVPWNQAGGGEVGSGLGPGVAPAEPSGKPTSPKDLSGAGQQVPRCAQAGDGAVQGEAGSATWLGSISSRGRGRGRNKAVTLR